MLGAFASLLGGYRRVAPPAGFVALSLLMATSAVEGQRLLTLVEGVAAASSTGDMGPSIGPVPVAVDVDLELLRGAPWRLEIPALDGSVMSAERSVFEDRGGGDLMWSGGQPGAGYDTVVLTVEGGRLVGRFGAAGGGVYGIHAERDGRGGMAPIAGPLMEDWCGVHADPDEDHAGHLHGLAGARADAPAGDPPVRASDPESHDRLDILVAYTATAAENWADRGGARAAIRHAGDYLKMVFRNNSLPVEPHIVHIAQASAALDRAGRDQPWSYRERGVGYVLPFRPLDRALSRDGDLRYLRHVHRADFLHLFTGEGPDLLGACGRHRQLWRDVTAERFSPHAFGWTTNDWTVCADYAVIFAHEIGHGLGADHDPLNGDRSGESLFRPYAYGHFSYDVMPSLGTAMSYHGQVEPFFSTPRLRPHGAVLGVAGQQDNERLLRETVHIGARYSDYLPEGLPAPPTELRVRYVDGAARLSWRDNAPDADGYELEYSYDGACCDTSTVMFDTSTVMLKGRTAASIALDHTEPGALYDFRLRARKGKVRSLRSTIVTLLVPGEPIAAPSDVSVGDFLQASSSADVSWTDNSDNETAFDVQILLDGEPILRQRAEANSEHASFNPWGAGIPFGHERYEARVFAYNTHGYSGSSETVPFRWAHPLDPPPPAGLSVSAIGPTAVRVSWTPDPGPPEYLVKARFLGWEHVERWFPSGSVVGRAHVDFRNLARGGRYRFTVSGRRIRGQADVSRPDIAHLILGERGEGPAAPSKPTYTFDSEGTYLGWEDNSNDETGFEVQRLRAWNSRGKQTWRRVLTVPANTESATHLGPKGGNYRVFAYNERGYSASSGRAVEAGRPPEASFRLYAQCREQLCWAVPGKRVRFVDTSSNVEEIRWSFGDGVASTLPSPHHSWSSPGRYAVTLSASNRWGRDSATREMVVGPLPPFGICRSDSTTLCLRDSRFSVSAGWSIADVWRRAAVVKEGTDDSGLFYIFDPSNWEILVKVLDGCKENGHMWVLGALTSDLGYRLDVHDTVTREWRRYRNEPGQPAPAIMDTEAFATACVDGRGGR